MKNFALLLVKGIALGVGIGLCLAGAVGILYRTLQGDSASPGAVTYFLVVGGIFGFLGGWCLALQMILGNLLSLVFLKVASLVPVQAARTGADWAQRMEGLFAEILKPMPSLFRWIVNYFFTSKFKDTERINRALERAKGSRPAEAYSPEWTARVILELLLQPIGVVFAIAYIGFFALVCLFWSFPFLR